MRGSERRRLAGLRAAIDGVPEGHRGAIAKMARMLGPDRLGGIDDELAGHIGGPAESIEKALMSALANHLRPQELPEDVLAMRLEWFGVSGVAVASLADGGIATVGDFITKTREDLVKGHGVSEAAAEEAMARLLSYGIRTIENPPEKIGK